MAQFKQRQGPKLPPPPPIEDASENLRAPETAPAPVQDRRSLKATGRTYPFATRVHPDWHAELKQYAAARKLKIVDVLEQAFEALKKSS